MVSLNSSTLPEGVSSGCSAGSARNSANCVYSSPRGGASASHQPFVPEAVEVGRLDAGARAGLAPLLEEVAQPGVLVALFGEAVADSRAPRRCRPGCRGRCAPGPTGAIALCMARTKRSRPELRDVVALERGGRRQHDVGVARERGPPRLLHDDGLGLRPGAQQAVQVLVVVERVAAGPPDDARVGVALIRAR